MELWIRSQNKIVLMKVDEICYAEVYKNEHTLWYRDIELGKYNSKERALEVLDEIQKLLQPQMVLSKVGKPIAETCDGLVYTEPNEYEIKELSTYVYEMPKE